MVERNLSVNHVTIWRWVQRYAPELHRRCRPELRMTNRSWRVDETYRRIAGEWTYLYRAVDSTGASIDFLLSPKRDANAAKRFFQKALPPVMGPKPHGRHSYGSTYPNPADNQRLQINAFAKTPATTIWVQSGEISVSLQW